MTNKPGSSNAVEFILSLQLLAQFLKQIWKTVFPWEQLWKVERKGYMAGRS